jgi:hypothetical protein
MSVRAARVAAGLTAFVASMHGFARSITLTEAEIGSTPIHTQTAVKRLRAALDQVEVERLAR